MRSDPRSLLLVATGGAAGAGARWAVLAGADTGTGSFPWWTLLVNVLGCLGLGLLARSSRTTALVLGTGFCGGLTTFSTFSVELGQLLEDGEVIVAATYLLASVAAGLAGVAAGRRIVTP